MIQFFRCLLIIALVISISKSVMAQATTSGANTITTAVPFLAITPDSRAGGMGDAGVGSTPDISSQHWNPAKYVFMESDMGVGLSYSPWLKNLVPDINLAYLSAYKKIDDMQALAASLRYFTLGEIQFTDINGSPLVNAKPNEFALDLSYSRILSEEFSGAVAIRYIRSDLTNGQYNESIGETNAGNAFATDVAFYFHKELRAGRKDNIFSAGINIQNIGSKISYNDGEVKDFIPTTLRLGAAYTMELDQYNAFSFSFEASKLLVPTPPINDTEFGDGDILLPGGINSDVGPIEGIFTSFGDAPGGLSEEMHEITYGIGVEYTYNEQFALRAGYFYEHENKGNRKYLTAGAGLKLNVFALDFSYLFPTQQNHPLANTLRFTLSFDVEAFSNQR